MTSAFGRAADTGCPCCENFGELPHLPGLPQAVDGEVVKRMCDECIDAAFLSNGTRSHPHPFIHAAQPTVQDHPDGSGA